MISDVITWRDSDLFNIIISDTGHVFYNLLPPKRLRVLGEKGYDLILPKAKTDRYKRAFVKRWFFKFISQFFNLNHFSFLSNDFCLALSSVVTPYVCCVWFLTTTFYLLIYCLYIYLFILFETIEFKTGCRNAEMIHAFITRVVLWTMIIMMVPKTTMAYNCIFRAKCRQPD